jgi:hypothetical protein
MTKAQIIFENREDEPGNAIDSRDFCTWYHHDDVQRLVWSGIPSEGDSSGLLAPYVFFNGLDNFSFDALMGFCRKRLESSDKTYFPFIITPELGGAHYFAGIVRKDDERTSLFLFNPVGSEKEHNKLRLKLLSPDEAGGMRLTLSKHPVQSIAKDGGTLVSCGPICVEFVRYAMQNPEWVARLDDDFRLPHKMQQLADQSSESYRAEIEKIRQSHHDLLGNIHDTQLDSAAIFFAPVTNQILENMNDYLLQEVDDDDYYENDDQDVLDQPVSVPKSTPKAPEDFTRCEQQFTALLKELQKKTSELIVKGTPDTPGYNPNYRTAAQAARTLARDLSKAQEDFFISPSVEAFPIFKDQCMRAITQAHQPLAAHRGTWHQLHPLIKGFLGVLATLTMIPALIIAAKSQHGYVHTFFNTPPTDSSKSLEEFKKGLPEDPSSTFKPKTGFS